MKNISIFLCVCLGFHSLAKAEFKVEIVPRTVASTDDDKNPFKLQIHGNSDLGSREMDAFKSCVVDITLVSNTAKQSTAYLLALTETATVDSLNTVLKEQTCAVYHHELKHQPERVTLSTPDKTSELDVFVAGELTDCLAGRLDESAMKTVHMRKPRFFSEEERLNKEELVFCPK